MSCHLSDESQRIDAASRLISIIDTLTLTGGSSNEGGSHETAIFSAIQDFLLVLSPHRPLYAGFHDGQVHNPLGGGAYAFKEGLISPTILSLMNDESTCIHRSSPGLTRPIIIHAGFQPNNSPHAGTLIVFSYAFLLAKAIHDEISAHGSAISVAVEIAIVDTAPISHETREIGGIQYQRAYRDDPAVLAAYMIDYEEVLDQMSKWSGISFRPTYQSDLFSHPELPKLLAYVVNHRARLASQLSPKYNTIALRAACPVPGCSLTEKHGILNQYTHNSITFYCPYHGEHSISLSQPSEIARLEANAPTRNLIRSMLHLLDKDAHHIRITGADYAGTYQEAFLYRPLAECLYVCNGGYETMEALGTDGLLSYARLRSKHGTQGLKRIWDEVERWITEPKNLFRASFSVEYLRAVLDGSNW
ncbi:uncharacterized protein TRIVIDRAFT_156397 [Trichoderma virens Gv29-8]|uniref:Uncharacterized protein n=1 Tax=Hypocrea virens (strain Gv29-8 / FGSC 10586) TaxID=413071 RepID=G9N161_HYPVG|nr:uncharacterized protein TRIVIDRAFT_156397 [Trichoderma virens Gv29-8]EHK19494.1 hypothetical protein TRIVIDRAFT_156397 [Trichoderma virens Gv29-8]